MNIRIAAILLLCSITALFPAALSAASAADEAAALFAGLRAAGAQLDGWTLDEVKSDAGSIHTRWTAPQSAAVLNIVLHARNEAAPSFAMTRLYNVFVETGSGGATLSDTESSFVNAFVSYIRLHETSAGALLPYDEFRQAEERRRVEENLQKKAVEARHRELESSSFARLLPAGVQMRDFGDTMALYLLPAFLLMLMFSLYVSKNAQLQMEPELRVYLRDIFNRAFKFIVIFQAGLAARHFSPDALINLVNSPLVPAGRPFDTLSNSFVYLILGGGEVRYIGAFLLLLALFFVFLHAAMLLSFLVFHERMHALAALVFVCSYPWFLLPVETLLPVLLFGWLFIHSLICAVLLARFSHHAWRLAGIMALATALACLIHPAALTAALYIPLAAVFNISNSRVAVGRFSNWIAWFAGVLSSAILLFKIGRAHV